MTLEIYEVMIVFSYLVVAVLTAFVVARQFRREKDAEQEFDAFFFLRASFATSLVILAGFIVLACALFWERQSLAVGFTSLIGIPGLFMVAAFMQVHFYRRYNLLDNFLLRFEQLTPAQRAAVLENLPPEELVKIPGDYRIISWEDNLRR
jgi:amino acid transporter